MSRWSYMISFPALALAIMACIEVVPEPGFADGEAGSSGKALVVTQDVSIASQHPYANHTDETFEVGAPAGATRLTLYFDRFETERGYDFVDIYNASGTRLFHLSGSPRNLTYTVEGSYARIRFTSDFSVTGWGFAISRFTYETTEPDHPTDHRPYCSAIGSRSEGWYWGDTGERIAYAFCADLDEPECGAIGSRSEGWYSNGDTALIAYDNCHRTVRLALEGESCGGSIGFSCHGESYCFGMPTGRVGGTGTCQPFGYCQVDNDCELAENGWLHPLCYGLTTSCGDDFSCRWQCGNVQPGPWSWTTILLREIESPHPYTNDYDETWDVVRNAAEAIQVHFPRIETEAGYDRLVLNGDREEIAVVVDGVHEDYWSPEFGGDTLHINLQTDYSVTEYGFRADMVRYYEQLPFGRCNVDDDCEPNTVCQVPNCFNPYAPCHGECVRPDHCDDGSQPMCRMMIPLCPEGTILAYQNSCYACVDPDTCRPESTAGGEGDACDAVSACEDGLFCKTVVDGVGECRDELWCDPDTVEADCANVLHPAIPGVWACTAESRCSWQAGMTGASFYNDQKVDIPDNDPAGIASTIEVGGMSTSCEYDLTVDLSIGHTYRGDLVVGLTDPAGNRSLLHVREGWGADNLVFDSLPVPELGHDAVNGTWILDVSDQAAWDIGTLENWAIHLTCQ